MGGGDKLWKSRHSRVTVAVYHIHRRGQREDEQSSRNTDLLILRRKMQCSLTVSRADLAANSKGLVI